MKYIYDNVKLEKLDLITLTLAGIFNGGDIVVLVGDIGAGKTTLVSRLAHSFESNDEVTSPTFNIVSNYKLPNSHRGIESITHVDAYRLTHVNEIYDLGFETIFSIDTLTMIEWGERIEDYIDKDHFRITIEEPEPDKRSYILEVIGFLSVERQNEIEDILTRDNWKTHV